MIEREAVPALRLRVVHRHVGVLQQRIEILAVAREQHDADRRGDEHFRRADRDRLRERLDDAVRRARGLLLGGDAVQQHDELVAALAAHVALDRLAARAGRILDAQHARESLRDHAQQVVADRVPERVVDALELVEIEEHDRERLAVRRARSSVSASFSWKRDRFGSSVSTS